MVALLNEWFPGCNGFRGDHLPDAWKGWWRLELAVVARLRAALGKGPGSQFYIRVGLPFNISMFCYYVIVNLTSEGGHEWPLVVYTFFGSQELRKDGLDSRRRIRGRLTRLTNLVATIEWQQPVVLNRDFLVKKPSVIGFT